MSNENGKRLAKKIYLQQIEFDSETLWRPYAPKRQYGKNLPWHIPSPLSLSSCSSLYQFSPSFLLIHCPLIPLSFPSLFLFNSFYCFTNEQYIRSRPSSPTHSANLPNLPLDIPRSLGILSPNFLRRVHTYGTMFSTTLASP